MKKNESERKMNADALAQWWYDRANEFKDAWMKNHSKLPTIEQIIEEVKKNPETYKNPEEDARMIGMLLNIGGAEQIEPDDFHMM